MTIRNLLIGLICSFAAMPLLAHADNLDIREWLVPWPKSEPRDVHVDQNGRVWFVGLGGDFIANLNPADGQFNRYDVQRRSRPS